MPKLSPVNAGKLIRILEKLEFNQIRQKGSHVRMEHSDGRKTTIPVHAGENVGVGLLRIAVKNPCQHLNSCINLSSKAFEKTKSCVTSY